MRPVTAPIKITIIHSTTASGKEIAMVASIFPILSILPFPRDRYKIPVINPAIGNNIMKRSVNDGKPRVIEFKKRMRAGARSSPNAMSGRPIRLFRVSIILH